MERYDTLIIGGGPAGLMAAIRAASLGRKTTVLENIICTKILAQNFHTH